LFAKINILGEKGLESPRLHGEFLEMSDIKALKWQ